MQPESVQQADKATWKTLALSTAAMALVTVGLIVGMNIAVG